MNENLKSHLHIPQSKKNIYVLNIIIQNISKKEDVKERGSKGTPKTLIPPIRVHKYENPENNLEGDINNTLVGLNHKAYQI